MSKDDEVAIDSESDRGMDREMTISPPCDEEEEEKHCRAEPLMGQKREESKSINHLNFNIVNNQ